MKDMFSFSFLWLAVWCTLFWINSYFHNQKAIYYSNGLPGSTWVWESISTYALYFLKENENDINKAVRHTLFLSTLWPNKNQSCEILCFKAGEFLETLAKGVQVGRDSPYLCSLPFIHFINRTFKRHTVFPVKTESALLWKNVFAGSHNIKKMFSHVCKHILNFWPWELNSFKKNKIVHKITCIKLNKDFIYIPHKVANY